MGQLDVLLNAQSKQTPGLVPPKATSGGGGLDILLKQGVKVPVSTPTIVAPPTVETQKKSLYQQISLLVENKLNGVFPGREEMGKIAEERRKASGKTAVRELISTIPSVYEPATRYVKDTAKIAVNAISGAGKLTPAYLFYRAVTGKPVTPKEYLSNNLSTGMETLSTLWRLNPVAPAFGSTLATVKALRQKAQGKDITWDDILDAPIKGINEQPGVGEAFTDNAKWAQAIDTIFLVGMFTRGAFKKGPKGEPSFAQRKLNKINLRAEELNQVSKTLEVKPGASLGKIGQAFKNKIKQIPDAFTSNPSPVSAARRVELTNAFNILKKAGVVEKKYAQAYEFLVSKFGRKGIKPPGVSGIVEAPERPLSGEGPVSPVAGKIEPSVLQIKDTKTGAIEYKTIPQGQLSEFKALIDTGTKGEVGIAGKEMGGKVHHLTAKTPEQMNRTGARFIGEAKIEEVPVQINREQPGMGGFTPSEMAMRKQSFLDLVTKENKQPTAIADKIGTIVANTRTYEEAIVKARSQVRGWDNKYTREAIKSDLNRFYIQAVTKKVEAPRVEIKPSEGLTLAPTKAIKVEEQIAEAQKLGLEGTIKIKTYEPVTGERMVLAGYNKALIGKAELQTLLQNSPELKANPVLTVNQDKNLEFVGERLKFHIKPEAMQLQTENLKVGQKIRIDEQALKKAPGIQQTRVYRDGEVYASRGVFSDLENLTKKLEKENLRVVEFPELVRISKELLGKTPQVLATRRGKYLGYFKDGGRQMDILLKSGAFKNPETASKLLAHELGHLADYLPEKTMARGNVAGRIAVLHKYLKNLYGELNNRVVRKELLDLSAKWRPVTDGKGVAEDLAGNKYRLNPKELYADAISVLFNDPARLRQEAPEFYRGFFEHLDRKQRVQKTFNEIWDLLNQEDEAIFRARDAELTRSFVKGEEVLAGKTLEKSKRLSSLLYQINLLFNDKNTPILSKINALRKAGKQIPAELNPDYALKGLNYYEGELKNYVNDNFQPIFAKAQEIPDGWNQLGKMVFYERVINERGELANPQGYNPETAKFQLEQTQRSMSTENWDKLQKAKEMFREAVQKSVILAEENGFYSPEMLSIMKANPAYATYQVIDHLDTYISPVAYHAIGTLKDIANPATSTVMKLISVHKAIKRNNAKKLNVGFLQKEFPESIQKAKTKWNGRFMEVRNPDDPRFGVVKIIEDGRAWGYYVEKDIADMLNYVPNPTLEGAIRISRVFSQSKFYRPLFTNLNLGFQSFNFVRDFNRYWKNMPDKTLGGAITSLPRAVLRYGMAVRPSLKRVLNRPNEIIKEMENLNILGLTYNDMFGAGETNETQQIERVLQRAGVSLGKDKRFTVFRPFEWALEGVEKAGNFIETLPKVAGYIELKGKMPEAELAQFIRTSVGSPDFRTG